MLFLIAHLLIQAHAVPAPVCGRLIPCGTFRGPSTQNFSDGESKTFETKLEISDHASGVLRVIETVVGTETKMWTLDFQLGDDDTVDLNESTAAGSRQIGRGRCRPGACFARLTPDFHRAGVSLDADGVFLSFTVNQMLPDGRAFTRLFRVSTRKPTAGTR